MEHFSRCLCFAKPCEKGLALWALRLDAVCNLLELRQLGRELLSSGFGVLAQSLFYAMCVFPPSLKIELSGRSPTPGRKPRRGGSGS